MKPYKNPISDNNTGTPSDPQNCLLLYSMPQCSNIC